jgi:hypothetical protein
VRRAISRRRRVLFNFVNARASAGSNDRGSNNYANKDKKDEERVHEFLSAGGSSERSTAKSSAG